MNNGNLLNSLLGITSTNSAATKSTAAKARAESSEKFQQALEQARPEVAARKPVARKEPVTVESSSAARTPKPADQRPPQQETSRAEARAKPPVIDKKVDDKTADKPALPAQDSPVDEPVDENQKAVEQVANPDQTTAGESQPVEGQVAVDTPLLTIENVLLADPAAALPAQSGELFADPESVLNTTETPLLTLGESADESDVELLDPDTGNSLLLPASGLLVTQAPLQSLVPEVSIDTVDTELSPLAATNQAVLVSGQAGATQVVDGQPLAIQVAGGNLTGKVIDELALDETVTLSATEGELAVDPEAGDNPDFLLLNSKAALNKLTEATITASPLDKTAPAADLAKPAAVSAAVETLTRLTEAQSPAARAFVVQTGVPVTVGSPQWSQAVGDKVLWLAAQNVSSAEIRLDPPELGAMQVKVSVNQDQTSITFTSPHPAVREALDQQLHRLREMFSDQGLNLVNVDVSDKSFAQQEREQDESAKNQGNADLEDDELAPVALTQAISMRLVDHYA